MRDSERGWGIKFPRLKTAKMGVRKLIDQAMLAVKVPVFEVGAQMVDKTLSRQSKTRRLPVNELPNPCPRNARGPELGQ